MKTKIKINFKDFWFPDTEENIKSSYFFRLLSTKYDLELNDNPDFLIYSWFGGEFYKYDCIRIYYTGENSRPNYNECDYSFSFDYPETEKNFRLPLFRTRPEFDELHNKHQISKNVENDKRKFCNFLYSNKRAEKRIEFFNNLQKYRNIDSGGKVLNNLGYTIDKDINEKLKFLSEYKFTIAFENSAHPGYTTEKILHAFLSGSIPIYWGNPLVAKDFNPKSFINCHDYNNFDEVIERIIEIDNNYDLYQKYLNEPALSENEENKYLNEQNILDKFEQIFMHKNVARVSRKTDILKYYYYNILQAKKYTRRKFRRIIRIKNQLF